VVSRETRTHEDAPAGENGAAGENHDDGETHDDGEPARVTPAGRRSGESA
jgi:hypothetical protein